MDNVDLTLFNVVNFNLEVRNVALMLIWCWGTSRRHINLKTTLKQRWNVCWAGCECARVLDEQGFWICLWFWKCQDSEKTDFWLYQGYTGFRICLNNSWICLFMSEYVWVCLSIPENARMCLNLCEWFLLYIFPFPHLFTVLFLLEHEVTYLNVCRRLEAIAWRNIRLFWWRDRICFFSSSWKYFICFLL